MTNETTNNAIKLLVVGTLCASLIGLFLLAYARIIDPTALVALVTTSIGVVISRYVTQQQEQAKAQAEIAELKETNAVMEAQMTRMQMRGMGK